MSDRIVITRPLPGDPLGRFAAAGFKGSRDQGWEVMSCKEMNGGRSASLRAICRHFTGVEIERPLLVGIDPLGLDVRGPFSVLRVRFPAATRTTEEAQQTLDQMIRESGEPESSHGEH